MSGLKASLLLIYGKLDSPNAANGHEEKANTANP